MRDSTAKALERVRFEICEFHDALGALMTSLAKLRETVAIEPHHIALDAWLSGVDGAIEDWHEAEDRSIAEHKKRRQL